MQFVAARWFTATRGRNIDVVVLHSMEAPEKGNTAENVARYFQTRPESGKVSAHYCIDNDSVVQCVLDQHVSYAAPGANHNGLQIEHAGYAKQSRGEWLDAYGRDMLRLSASLVAGKAARYGIPIRFVDHRGLVRGERGITTHAQVSAAFRKSDHTDPGVHFPMDYYLGEVERAAKGDTSEVWRMAGVRNAVAGVLIPGHDRATWVLGADGSLHTFPEDGKPKPFFGSMGGRPLLAPMVDIVPVPGGGGYWLIGADGGVFAFGNATPVQTYEPLRAEYQRRERAVVGGEWVKGPQLRLVADDGSVYTYTVQAGELVCHA